MTFQIQSKPTLEHSDFLIRIATVLELTGFGRTKIHEMVKANAFPRPIGSGANTRYSLREVSEWIEQQKAARELAAQ